MPLRVKGCRLETWLSDVKQKVGHVLRLAFACFIFSPFVCFAFREHALVSQINSKNISRFEVLCSDCNPLPGQPRK